MRIQHREDFLTFSTVFLLGLLLVSMGLAWLSGVEPMQHVHWSWRDVGIGVLSAFAMTIAFASFTSVRNEAEEALGQSLAVCHWYDLAILAILVGIIEEILFRGVLEPWAARIHPMGAFIAVNLFFGALHAISRLYFLVATILGMYLSLLAHGFDEFNLLRPIVAHAVYDYIGFIWIRNSFLERHSDFDFDRENIDES